MKRHSDKEWRWLFSFEAADLDVTLTLREVRSRDGVTRTESTTSGHNKAVSCALIARGHADGPQRTVRSRGDPYQGIHADGSFQRPFPRASSVMRELATFSGPREIISTESSAGCTSRDSSLCS